MDTKEIRVANLRALLAEEDGKQVRLAGRLGVSPSQLNQWFSGVRTISEESARKLEKASGKPVGWLDGDRTEEASPIVAVVPMTRPKVSLGLALNVLGQALEAEMPQDVREDIAHALSNLARRRGALRDQQMVEHLLGSLKVDSEPTKRVA